MLWPIWEELVSVSCGKCVFEEHIEGLIDSTQRGWVPRSLPAESTVVGGLGLTLESSQNSGIRLAVREV